MVCLKFLNNIRRQSSTTAARVFLGRATFFCEVFSSCASFRCQLIPEGESVKKHGPPVMMHSCGFCHILRQGLMALVIAFDLSTVL